MTEELKKRIEREVKSSQGKLDAERLSVIQDLKTTADKRVQEIESGAEEKAKGERAKKELWPSYQYEEK